ncbi:MAG: BLUF domain-containing protein [Hyphomicrobium sp.]|nr:BLUF domain-containing protein [Hyphomicrobium sp.]
MPLVQLIYASRPFGYDDLTLDGILYSARRNNTRDGITGSLICREDIYCQLLEGPAGAVNSAFDRIRHDRRHTDVSLLVLQPAEARLFPNWSMRHDPARSWMWSPAEIETGALSRAKPDDVLGVFSRITVENTPGQTGCPHRPL